MFQLLYTSFIAPDITANMVSEMVQRAREKNTALSVTGILVFDGLCFCQYLEGPSETLYPLLGEIRADRRHLNFSLQEHDRLDGPRLFPNSPLAFAKCNDPNSLDRIAQRVDGQTRTIEQLRALLPALRIEEY